MTDDGHAPVISVSGLSVSFPKRENVVDDLNFAIHRGERVIILGPSGAGKTTVLRALCGIVPHSVRSTIAGEVRVANRDVAHTPVVELARDVGLLAQDPAAAVCLPHVEQELALPLENQAVDPNAFDSRIRGVLTTVEAHHLWDRETSTLSGGELQRVGLAAALVTNPSVLLLDEPTSMLDPVGVRQIRRAVEQVKKSHEVTTVFIEHRVDEWVGEDGVSGLPEKAIILAGDGTLIDYGATQDVLLEHSELLSRAGCWLPVEAEIHAATGELGGVHNVTNQEFLTQPSVSENSDIEPRAKRRDATALPESETLFATSNLNVSRVVLNKKERKKIDRGELPQPTPVVRDVGLDLQAGEVTAIMGPNGAGKTTLLLTLARLIEPLSGSVTGEIPGMVFQNPEHQFLATNVWDEIGAHLPADDPAIAQQLAQHRLQHVSEQDPFRLSGGEKRRLSLAAVMAHQHQVLLADEPTFGLDRGDWAATATALRNYVDEGNSAAIVTHDVRLAARVADQVVVLNQGRVWLRGSPAEVFIQQSELLKAQIVLPPLVRWLVENHPHGVASALARLDQAQRVPENVVAHV